MAIYFRILLLILILVGVAFWIIKVNSPKIRNFSDKKSKKTAKSFIENRMLKDKVVFHQDNLVILMGKDYFIIWLEEPKWGVRQFVIEPKGTWDRKFELKTKNDSETEKIRLKANRNGLTLFFEKHGEDDRGKTFSFGDL